MPSETLVLLGDSILDNAPYTSPEPDTTQHLRNLMPSGWQVQRLAQDGAVMASIRDQLSELPQDATTAVLSVGGNDATEHIGLLDHPASNAADVLDQLVSLADDFATRYEEVARSVVDRVSRTILCTIYEVQLEPPSHARLARAPLGLLNDQIVQVGSALGLEVLELRSVCTDPSDFVLQIEPSAQGARKIAEAIAAVVVGGNGAVTPGRVFSA